MSVRNVVNDKVCKPIPLCMVPGLPFRYWFIAIHLLTGTKKSFSASELQRQLEHKYYELVWVMVHKLRMVTGKRDEVYALSGVLELGGDSLPQS